MFNEGFELNLVTGWDISQLNKKLQMKIALISLFFFLALSCFSQSRETDKIKYDAPGIYFVLQDQDGKEITRIPEGKDVMIEYDTFFKSYDLIYKNSQGTLSMLKLEYRKEEDGIISVVDRNGNSLIVMDFLETKGGLLIVYPEKREGKTMMFLVNQAKRVSE